MLLGGLARRATVLSDFRNLDGVADSLLLLGGPEDFLKPPGTEDQTKDDLAAPLYTAFTMMDYDLLLLKEYEKAWLDANAGQDEVTEPFVGLSDAPRSFVLPTDKVTFGVLVFPELPPETHRPDDDMIRDVAQAALELRSKVDLVIGMSPWGKRGELYFLDETENVLHILLGGGPGPSENGRLMEDDHTLWIRSFTKGKYLHLVNILALPGEDGWKEDENYRASALDLVDTITEQPEVRALFHKDL